MIPPSIKLLACAFLFVGTAVSSLNAQIVSNTLDENDDVIVQAHIEECQGEQMLFFDITNNSSAPKTFDLVIEYNHNGVIISETQKVEDLPSSETFFLTCATYQNFPKFGFASLGDMTHEFDSEKLNVSIVY